MQMQIYSFALSFDVKKIRVLYNFNFVSLSTLHKPSCLYANSCEFFNFTLTIYYGALFRFKKFIVYNQIRGVHSLAYLNYLKYNLRSEML
jgi:hypothetical protein